MRLPENQELRKWAEKNVHSDAARHVFSTMDLKDGDLDQTQTLILSTIILLAARQQQKFRETQALVSLAICLAIISFIF